MKKNFLRNERGITIIAILLTVFILSALTFSVISNIDIGTDIRNYNYMCADIELLESKILAFYNKYNGIPVIRN